jgi:hypothetical protein
VYQEWPNDWYETHQTVLDLTGCCIGKLDRRNIREFFWKAACKGWLVGWLFTVSRPAQEFVTHMETSPLPVKGCKFRPMLGA